MKEQKFGNICWFSNMDNKRYKSKKLTERFDPDKYPKYDNYDAINVDKIKDIPFEYDGVMGVPITVLEYLCPDGYIYFEVDEDQV